MLNPFDQGERRILTGATALPAEPPTRLDNLRVFPSAAQSSDESRPFGLSERQLEAVYLTEFSNKEISYLMDCAQATVKAHLRAAFPRIGVSTRTAAYKRLIEALAKRDASPVIEMPQQAEMERAA